MESKDELDFSTKSSKRYPVRGVVNSVATPIFTSSNFVLESTSHGAALCNKFQTPLDQNYGTSPYIHARWGNPTNDVAEQIITSLEGGHASFVTASGMAAITTTLVSFLKAGDHLILPEGGYSGTYKLVTSILKNYSVEVSFVDPYDIQNYETAIRPNTKVLYGETPLNPTMRITDLEGFSKIGKKHNILTIVDNTFSTAYHTRPIQDFGIDIVVCSTTYLGGHSDLTAGCITVTTEDQAKIIQKGMLLIGAICSPHNSFLLQRGIKTLDMRMQRHSANALAIAKYLEKHPKVKLVNYPGLESNPQHNLAKKIMRNGFGGMISFELQGGMEAARILIDSVKLITIAVSLGGVESLIEHPASMTHRAVPKEEREKAGISDALIRLSVGVESERDLISDLEKALSLIP